MGSRKWLQKWRENNIVHIITDNGSNYKKTRCYHINEYRHIAWQLWLTHTVNL
jgi:hypothetical protein